MAKCQLHFVSCPPVTYPVFISVKMSDPTMSTSRKRFSPDQKNGCLRHHDNSLAAHTAVTSRTCIGQQLLLLLLLLLHRLPYNQRRAEDGLYLLHTQYEQTCLPGSFAIIHIISLSSLSLSLSRKHQHKHSPSGHWCRRRKPWMVSSVNKYHHILRQVYVGVDKATNGTRLSPWC